MNHLRTLLSVLLVILCISTTQAQCPASSPLVINATSATQSRCQASGTATVSVSGGSTPYTFSLVAGPTTRAAQSSNVFSSLAPGTYTVQVIDNCGTSVTGNFSVTGNYTVPAPTATAQPPSCPGGTDGSIIVAVTGGQGPFSYSLISPSPVTAGPQTSNEFANLTPGNYTYRVSDSCGNFQTRTVTIAAATAESMSLSENLQYVACDSFSVTLTASVPGNPSNDRPPYTVSATLPNGQVISQVYTSAPGTIQYSFHFHHVTGSLDPITFTITDNCGSSQTSTLYMGYYLDMNVGAVPPSGCGGQYSYVFSSAVQCGVPTYTLISPSGSVLAVQTNNSWFQGFPPGSGYKLVRQECCSSDTLTFDWGTPPGFHISNVFTESYATCREGTAGILLVTNTSNLSSVIVASGPPSMTLADGTVYTFTYPETINTGVSNGAFLDEFPTGTYKIYAVDVCGEEDSTTLTINGSDLRHDTFSASMIAGCSGNNSIKMQGTSSAGAAGLEGGSIYVNSADYADVSNGSYSFTDGGLGAGTYYLSYTYDNIYGFYASYLPGLNSGCDVLRDTINIPVYTQPSFATLPAIANCGATQNVSLLPDSASGVQPYTFQIIAPTAGATQSSPVFPGLTAGTYTFLMSDACGNSYSSNISVDTLAISNVAITGSTCAGGAATFTLPGSPFFSYTWQHPDGSTSTGDTLAIDPVTSADTGTYKISLTSTIGGCTSTTTKSLSLSFCTVLAEQLLQFSGQMDNGVVQLAWQSAIETNLDDYVVERSTDGISFAPLWQVKAKDGTMNSYAGDDTHPPTGVVYYRLKMVDADGTYGYSQVIAVSGISVQPFNVYPRLLTGKTTVTATYPQAGPGAFVRVVDVDGKVWQTLSLPLRSTSVSINVDGLASGVHFFVFGGSGASAAIEVVSQ